MARRKRHPPLRVQLNNSPVGKLQKASSGAIDFQYDAEWLIVIERYQYRYHSRFGKTRTGVLQ